MNLQHCPECRGALETGWINAPSIGIYWTDQPRRLQWFWQLWSKAFEPLQRDWWGFPKLFKDSLRAQRCRHCNLVLFRASKKQS